MARVAGCVAGSLVGISDRLRHRSTLRPMTYRSRRARTELLASGSRTLVTDRQSTPTWLVPATPSGPCTTWWPTRRASPRTPAGNMEGAPGDAWTAAQVARGAGRRSPSWWPSGRQTRPMLEGFLSSPAGRARRRPSSTCTPTRPTCATRSGCPSRCPPTSSRGRRQHARRLRRRGRRGRAAPVRGRDRDFEWFRGRLGRRTEAEVSCVPVVGRPGAVPRHVLHVRPRRARRSGEAA